jgi:hypothetical protein
MGRRNVRSIIIGITLDKEGMRGLREGILVVGIELNSHVVVNWLRDIERISIIGDQIFFMRRRDFRWVGVDIWFNLKEGMSWGGEGFLAVDISRFLLLGIDAHGRGNLGH